MTAREGLWLDGVQRSAFKIGERFEITNPDKPAWCNGWFEVEEFLLDGRVRCKRVEGPGK